MQSTTFDRKEHVLFVSVDRTDDSSVYTLCFVCMCIFSTTTWCGLTKKMIKTHPVPISLNPSYLLRGSKDETGTLGSALRSLRSNSFADRGSGGSCGMSVLIPAGSQGRLDMFFSGLYDRKIL